MAHVEAVGYGDAVLKFSTTWLYPHGGTLSAPVKKDNTIASETLSSLDSKRHITSHGIFNSTVCILSCCIPAEASSSAPWTFFSAVATTI